MPLAAFISLLVRGSFLPLNFAGRGHNTSTLQTKPSTFIVTMSLSNAMAPFPSSPQRQLLLGHHPSQPFQSTSIITMTLTLLPRHFPFPLLPLHFPHLPKTSPNFSSLNLLGFNISLITSSYTTSPSKLYNYTKHYSTPNQRRRTSTLLRTDPRNEKL